MPQTPKLDPMKLTSEQRDKLEAYEHSKRTVEALSDLVHLSQQLADSIDKQSKDITKDNRDIGALLVDMRDSLTKIKQKEAPEAPDYAKPVVEAVDKLEKAFAKAIKGIDVRPEVSVSAPPVNVDAPVNVDLKGVEKLLKTEMPKAFKEAISKIPKVDIPKQSDRWDEVLEWLESIDTASRMKPLPGSMTINNSLSNPVNIAGETTEPDYATRLDDSADPIIYSGKAAIGSATSSAVWQVVKLDTTSGLVKTWADGDASFDNIWDDRASLSYS